MLFNTVFFIIFFFPLSLIIYSCTSSKYKPVVMLVISSVYCGMISIYLLAFTYLIITLNYFSALYILKKRLVYILVITVDILLFVLLKTRYVSSFIMPMYSQNIFLLVCISFFMLQIIGYINDVYRGRIFAEKNYLNFALYILFFPKFMMGSVVKYQDFYPFLKRSRTNLSMIGKGVSIFIKGLSKNIIIGGSVYQLWDIIKNINPINLSALSAWLGIASFSLSFYFCLSGFIDMSNGISCCFGYRFSQDFDHPFFTVGLSDFSSKWHISITKWFEKYTFGFLKKHFRHISVIIMWGLIGLWYELSLNKLIWGLIIGTALLVEKILGKKNILCTFVVISLSWAFFSQSSLMDSFMFLKALLGGNNNFADSLSFYFLKSYIVILLIAIYTSTDLFKNLMEKIKDWEHINFICNMAMPFADFLFLVISISAITVNSDLRSISLMFG